MISPIDEQRIQAIERPDAALWKYYILVSLVFLPAFPIVVTVMYFRYHTMRYKFSEDEISMSWGILFRRETIVNYARIQDIHLKSNIVERWLGLCRILIQTASGSQSEELTIEGIKEFELLRDFLYSRMRGVKDAHAHSHSHPYSQSTIPSGAATTDELTLALREAVTEMRAIRSILEKREPARPEETPHV
jgi:uncharacterized membrane protein YdbT with pleckstrin-like domain